MKTVIFIIFSIFFLTACQTKKDATPTISQTANSSEEIKSKTQEAMIVEYEASSRGYYSKVTLENNIVSISKDRNNVEKPQTIKVSSSDLSDLTSLLPNLNPESLANLKGPTEKRFYDGAPHANLKITKNGKSFETQGFDAGFPPKEIEKLVSKLVSFSEDK